MWATTAGLMNARLFPWISDNTPCSINPKMRLDKEDEKMEMLDLRLHSHRR